jgi:hypothetical protein
VWRRPAGGGPGASPEPAPAPAPAYTPPPRTERPLPGQPRGPLLVPVPPPPEPPEQDHAAIDAAERHARLVTLAVGTVAGLVATVLLIVITLRLAGR